MDLPKYKLDKLRTCPLLTTRNDCVAICNVMGITPHTADEAEVRVIDERKSLILVTAVVWRKAPTVRGTIVDTTPGKVSVTCGGHPHTPESDTFPYKSIKNTVFTKAVEGTILRVSRDPVSGECLLSTFNRIDGYNGRWGTSLKFGDMFRRVWGDAPFDYYLSFPKNKRLSYSFLVFAPEMRIVRKSEPTIHLVGVFDGSVSLSFTDFTGMIRSKISESKNDRETSWTKTFEAMCTHPGVKLSYPLKFDNAEQVNEYAKSLDVYSFCGLLCTTLVGVDKTISCHKIVSKEYTSMWTVRGESPNMKMSYLSARKKGEESKHRELYPEKTETFDELDDYISTGVPVWLSRKYMDRFSRRRLPKEDLPLLEKEQFMLINYVRMNYIKEMSLIGNIQKRLEYLGVGVQNKLIKQYELETKSQQKETPSESKTETMSDTDTKINASAPIKIKLTTRTVWSEAVDDDSELEFE